MRLWSGLSSHLGRARALADPLRPSSGAADPRLFRSFVILHLVGPLITLPICAALLALDRAPGPVAGLFTAGVCLFLLLPFVARANLATAAFISVQLLSLVSLFGAYFYGGLNSPFMVWLVVAGLLGFLYIPTAIGRSTAAMATQTALFLLANHFWPQVPRLASDMLGGLFLASSFTAAVYVSLIAAFYSRIRSEGSELAKTAVRYAATASRARATVDQLQADNRRAADFMTRSSHEVRTALDVVIGYSELLLEDATVDEREADERRLNRIAASSRQMLALVADGDQLADASPRELEGGRPLSEVAVADPSDAVRPDRARRARLPLWARLFDLRPWLVIAAAATLLIPAAGGAALYPLAATLLILAALGRQTARPAAVQTDALTGLPNRETFRQELERRLSSPRQAEAALLFADLDGFKEVNDSLGHDVGDQLLAQVADRFAQSKPPGLLLARLGGDEFGAVAFGPGAEALVRSYAEAMLDALVEPVRTDEHQLTIGVSIGLAHGLAGQVTGKELLRRSDVAMYRAKQDKRVPIRAFDLQMDEALNFRRTMRQDLAEALCGDQLDLHLQPVVDARTGELASVEALLRWSHPLLGPVSAAKLITLAEESGQIVAIDDWVLERALVQARRLGSVPIAINISPAQFRHPGFARKIVGRLEAHAIPPQLLRLEITEGVLVTHTRAAGRAIAELREAGVKIALDDFGTGYSSLSYLKDFGFDLLKVDRSFITALDQGRQGAELLRAIIDLGHSLSMSLIAEGVETAEQAAVVQLLGCDFIQGYFTGRPMSVDQLEQWIADRESQSIQPAARFATPSARAGRSKSSGSPNA
ncbi:MAG: putative bifunctional diguanylate cyclase/phosphodiesterase [Allosphingosinicella sp.]